MSAIGCHESTYFLQNSIAQTLHFVDAPHLLPLAEGQSVPMRAWWRHRGILNADEDEDTKDGEDEGQEQAGAGDRQEVGLITWMNAIPVGKSGGALTSPHRYASG